MNLKAAFALLALALSGMTAHTQLAQQSPQPVPPTPARRSIQYDKLPLGFEPNVGQTSSQVQWLARGLEYTLFLSGRDAVLELNKATSGEHSGDGPRVSSSVVRMNLLGANPSPKGHGEQPEPGKVNYFTGKNPADWQHNVSLYGRVHLDSVYPGIDLAYYGRQGQLEYDFMVAPDADPSAIHLAFDGATPRLADNGDLVLPVNGNEVRFDHPVVYQMVNGKRQVVDGSFDIVKNGNVSFHLGPYDHSRELVIDPTLVYTGTFGTASENDAPAGMAVDSQGELIITGTTLDLNFPATSGAYQTSCSPVSATDTQNGVFRCAVGDQPGAMSSAYVAKLNADGTQLIYATYLHGITGWEKGAAVQADASGNAVVIGQTASADFPLVNAPAIPQMSLCQPLIFNGQTAPSQSCSGYFNGGGTEWTIQGPTGFISKLSADGSKLLYSAFMGFSGTTYPHSLALDASGNMYMLSQVNNADPDPNPGSGGEVFYPTTSTAFQTAGVGDYETALTVLSADGQKILYSTIYGETKPIASGCGSCLNGTVPSSIAVGQNGTVFIAGETRVATLPVTANVVQTSCVESTPTQCANNVGYVAAFNINKSGASSLEWATYVSGPDNPNTAVSTQLNSIAADASNNVYLTGYTTDALFPITKSAYASTCPLDGRSGANFCDNSVFVSKLNSSGTAYDWSTFIAATQGAASGANSNGIAVDPEGKVYVYGDSGNLNIPAVNPLPQYSNDWYQPYPFLTVLNPTGSNVIFSSQVAPNNFVSSMQNGLALDSAGNIYMVGNTQGNQTYFVGNTTLTSWPTTEGTYSTPFTGTGPVPFFVKVAAVLNPTATTLTASPATTVSGQKVTFTATVAGTTQSTPAPTGAVTLTNTSATPATTLGTIDLSNGTGTYSTTSLAAGTYKIVATYSADSVYDTSTSTATTVTITALQKATVALTVPGTAIVGSSVTFSATVTGSGGTPTGTVTFSDGSTTLGSGTLSSGKAAYTTKTLAAGMHTISAAYSGDSTFGSATSSPSTIDIAALPTPTIALKLPSSAVSGSSVTLNATVSGSGTTLTGTVKFLDGTAVLNTATLASGSASYSTSSLAVGAHSITAQYSGDSNYSSVASAAQTVTITAPAPDFSVDLSPASGSVTAGSTTTTMITVTPANGFDTATTFSCSGLPAYSSCAFSPTSVTPNGKAAPTTLTIATNVASASAALDSGVTRRRLHRFAAAGSGGAILALLFWPSALRRKQRQAWLRMLGVVMFSLLALHTLTGCGGSSKSSGGSGSVTPSGTSTVTITATAGSLTHTTAFTLTVN
ncbi:DUF7948 domain-containing protein [Terracidiphilus gabretensis]|uniref:DUF7948 domain-containing protein n=1 Tax=Terracidiphilus gabretensis TaxID=1577687 RepID=UPI00071B8C2C|nr:Ig-like domain repeat protein [Terracidiphilus gabretensis]